jgi:hypothetical protein
MRTPVSLFLRTPTLPRHRFDLHWKRETKPVHFKVIDKMRLAERLPRTNVSIDQLKEWLTANENEHLEFIEAKNNFHFERLVKYCAALVN